MYYQLNNAQKQSFIKNDETLIKWGSNNVSIMKIVHNDNIKCKFSRRINKNIQKNQK